MRNLERQLATICRKAARRIIEKPDAHLRLTNHSLEQYLGTPRYSDNPANPNMQVGVAMGLAVTEMGGILLPVEVATMGGKGDLLITGQLGEVMRESAVAALSYIRSRAEELQIDPNFLDTTDLHIHMPENALPKDGPSAGITIAIALISALTGRHIRGGLAMTGEITLRGRVLGIGGLKEKVLAAHAANIYHLLIPSENKKDLAEIPAKVRQHIHITMVDRMEQVIDAALLDMPANTESRRQAEEKTPSEPVPLYGDERKLTAHEQPVRRPAAPDAEDGNETNEHRHDPLLMPPADHRITGNPYPQIQAHD